MLWQFFVGRFLQVAAGIGVLLTLADWVRFGGAHVRVGRTVGWSLAAGALAAAIATYRVHGARRPR